MDKLIRIVSALILSILVFSCGGGTSGTGGVTVNGQVSDRSSKALGGVEVSVLNTGDGAVTDAAGNFSFRTELVAELDLIVESSNASDEVSIGNIPDDAEEVKLKIIFDEDDGEAEAQEVEIRRRGRGNGNSGENDDDNSGSGGDDEDDDDANDDPDDDDQDGEDNDDTDEDEDSDDDEDSDGDSGSGSSGGGGSSGSNSGSGKR